MSGYRRRTVCDRECSDNRRKQNTANFGTAEEQRERVPFPEMARKLWR